MAKKYSVTVTVSDGDLDTGVKGLDTADRMRDILTDTLAGAFIEFEDLEVKEKE